MLLFDKLMEQGEAEDDRYATAGKGKGLRACVKDGYMVVGKQSAVINHIITLLQEEQLTLEEADWAWWIKHFDAIMPNQH